MLRDLLVLPILLIAGTAKSTAAVVHYSTVFTVSTTGNATTGTINPGSITVGDSFQVSFSVDGDSLQTASSDGVAVFSTIVLNFKITPMAGNLGNYVPTFTANPSVGIYDNNGLSRFSVLNTVSGGNTAGYERDAATGNATFFRFSINSFLDQPFVNRGIGTPLSSYLQSSTAEWTGDGFLGFRDTGVSIRVEGSTATIPEPAIAGSMAVVGIAGALIRRRSRSNR